MTDLFRTLIAPNGQVVSIRQTAENLNRADYSKMFDTPCNATGTGNPTHWISSGYVKAEWLTEFEILTNPSVDISDEDPFVALARLGLTIIQTGEA
jgi:hypothetical protein